MNEKPKMQSVIHLLLSDYIVDSRVRNETEMLAKKYDVKVLCYGKFLSREQRSVNIKKNVTIISYPKKYSSVGILKTWFNMLLEAKSLKPVLLHAHDVNSLPLGFVLAKYVGAKFIYDSHELWSQSHHKKRAKIILLTIKIMELFLAKKADCIITVSNNIARYLRSYFNHNHVYVIRNIPTYMKPEVCKELSRNLIRNKWAVDDKKLVVLYQGLLKSERGIFVIADAIKMLTAENFLFVFMGEGPDQEQLKKYIFKNNLNHVVKFQESVKQDILACYTKSADIGVHAIQNTCLNHDFCLPNKLFEYAKCEIPIVVSNLTEMGEFVKNNGFGVTFEDGNAISLATRILEFKDNTYRNKFIKNLRLGKNKFSENKEYSKLYHIYEDLIGENNL